MFKDAENGNKEINIERTEDALETKPEIIAAGCPFFSTIDGIKIKEKSRSKVMDVQVSTNARFINHLKLRYLIKFTTL
jgi:predicted aconitase